MNILSTITIQRDKGTAALQLINGDLSAIPPEHGADLLVISAYPGDYTPLEGSLIYALDRKGLSIESLSFDKAVDQTSTLHCWLSKPLSPQLQQQLNIRKVLCFEPGAKLVNPEEAVSDIFRCINTFAFEQQNNVVALPVVAAGRQKIPFNIVLPALINTALFWLDKGLPLQCIKLVIYRKEQAAGGLEIFEAAKRLYGIKTAAEKGNTTLSETIAVLNEFRDENAFRTPSVTNMIRDEREDILQLFPGYTAIEKDIYTGVLPVPQATVLPPSAPTRAGGILPTAPTPASESLLPTPETAPPVIAEDRYDYFISYAHTHSNLIDSFVEKVKAKHEKMKIFYDRDSIPAGSQWIRQISAAIQKADKILVFLSPDYDKSPVCWDEFQCAKLMEYNKRKQLIQTIYLYDYKDIEMPPIMGIYSYIDCREGDDEKLTATIARIFG